MKTFEEYLRDNVWEAEGILDDDMPDAFEGWLGALDTQEVMDLADDYGRSMWFKGSRNAIIELNKAIEPLTLEDDEQLTREKRQEEAEQAMQSDFENGLLDY